MANVSELSFDDLPGGSDQPRRKLSASAFSFDDLPGGDVSTATDMAKAAAYALPKAGAGFMGLPRDLSDLGAAVRNKLTSYLPEDWQGGVSKADAAIRALNPADVLARNMPGSGQIRANLEQTTGPWYD